MNVSVQVITWQGIVWAFVPVAVTLIVIARWSLGTGTAVYALVRMLIQLLAVGLVLNSIFAAEHAIAIAAVLGVMITAASWIAIRPLADKTRRLYTNALLAILIGGGLTLWLVTQLVLDLEPWFNARYVIPLAGMVFANAMNAVSLSAERFESERNAGHDYLAARQTAMRACLIPLLNSLFAVGLVSLPGMMTGQILSGVSPVIAAKYQVVVMCMIFGASGVSAALYLHLSRPARTN